VSRIKAVLWASIGPVLGIMALAMMFVPSAAEAADPGADNAKAAKEAYSRGSAFFNLGQYTKAIEAWQHGYELTSEPSFLYNLGQAARLSNDPDRALFFYKGYLRNKPHAPNRDEVEKRVRALEAMISTREKTNHDPPIGTAPPASQPEPHAAAPGATNNSAESLTITSTTPTPTKTPIYKRWWLWTAVGVVVVAVGVGVGVGVTHSPYTAPGVTF